MILNKLDSRENSGTDLEKSHYPSKSDSFRIFRIYPQRETVRVIVGKLGDVVRFSAPRLNIVSQAANKEQAWTKFLAEARKREDSVWLRFDVGPTRPEEMEKGLNAPEDEDWSEQITENED